MFSSHITLLKAVIALHAAFLLPLVPAAPAAAQSRPPGSLAALPSTSFADFEGGTWATWTVTGDAFGDAPATNALFPGKIKGFGGLGFACTLNPRTGNAATGKAVSPEFTIERPLITFKIGGGNLPLGSTGGQACVNLVVDGQVLRTASGNGLPSLSNVVWDVSALAGKKARLEIIDNSASPNRGYILVDDIAFDGNTNGESLPLIEIPLRIIQMLDARGNARLEGGIRTVMTAEIAAAQVAQINRIYQPTGIRFTLDVDDFETRRNDYLNRDFDDPPADIKVNNHDEKPKEIGRSERLLLFRKVGEERKDRLTIIVHRGSEWQWEERQQKWLLGEGVSLGGSVLRNSPPRVCSAAPRVWAHELGHTLGLPHTSTDDVRFPSTLTNVAAVTVACQEYVDKGGDPNHPEYAIDGDRRAGIEDTLPDPGLGFWRGSEAVKAQIEIRLRNGEPVSLTVSRDNIMGAIAHYGGFTKGQITVMRRRAETWLAQVAKPG